MLAPGCATCGADVGTGHHFLPAERFQSKNF
jgi:hypothetical protein